MKSRYKAAVLTAFFIISGTNIAIRANEIPQVNEGMEYQCGSATPESINEGESAVSYTATASDWFYDSDGDELTYSLSLLSSEQDDIGEYSIDIKSGEIVYTPSQNAAGKQILFLVNASDGSGMMSLDNVHITITVDPIPGTEDSELLTNQMIRFNDTVSIPYISNGNKLTRIEFEDIVFSEDIDYSFTDDTITLNPHLLKQLPDGENTLRFIFSGGNAQILTLSISDNTEYIDQCSISVFDEYGNVYYIDQVEKNSILELKDYIPSGNKVFKGWYTEPNGKGEQWFSGSAVLSNLHLYPYVVDKEDAYITDINIDGYDIDFDPDTYLYFISDAPDGLDIKVDTSYDSASVYWSIISGGNIQTIDTTQNSIHLDAENLSSAETRIIISSQGPDLECDTSYSIVIENGFIENNTTNMDPDIYSAYYKPTVRGMSTAITDFGDTSDISLSYGSLKEIPPENAEIERNLKEKYQEVIFYDISLQLKNEETGNITNIDKSLPIDLAIHSPLPSAFGWDYAVYYIDGESLEEIDITYSSETQVSFPVSKYGRYVICYNRGINIKFISDNSEYTQYNNIEKGSEIELPQAPAKSHYTFRGWFTEPNGKGEQILNGHKIYEDTVLYSYFVRKPSGGSSGVKTTPSPTASPAPTQEATESPAVINEKNDILQVSSRSGEIEIFINGEKITFPDAQPFIDPNDRTLAPIRYIAEAIGYDVDWIQDSKTAVLKKDNTVITIEIGNNEVFINNDSFTMDTAAQIKDDRTFIPVRAIGELTGYTVEWIY